MRGEVRQRRSKKHKEREIQKGERDFFMKKERVKTPGRRKIYRTERAQKNSAV